MFVTVKNDLCIESYIYIYILSIILVNNNYNTHTIADL